MLVRIIFVDDYRKQKFATVETLGELKTLIEVYKSPDRIGFTVEIEFSVFSSEDILLTVDDQNPL